MTFSRIPPHPLREQPGDEPVHPVDSLGDGVLGFPPYWPCDGSGLALQRLRENHCTRIFV